MNFPRPTDLPLHHVPGSAWSRQWNKLLTVADMAARLDRTTTIEHQLGYLRANAPELSRVRDRAVLELNAGPCTSLEIARFLGHIGHAIVPVATAGDHYANACRLLHTRQGLDVEYDDLLHYLVEGDKQRRLLTRFAGRCQLVSCTALLDLLPLEYDHTAQAEHVSLSAAAAFFALITELLCPSGILLLGLGRSPGATHSHNILRELANECGLQLVRADSRIQKWRLV